MRVNVEALFAMTQAVVPSILEAARGSVIKVSSMFGRVASAREELDGVHIFLATDASSYCTEQTIVVDGGWTLR